MTADRCRWTCRSGVRCIGSSAAGSVPDALPGLLEFDDEPQPALRCSGANDVAGRIR